jgi:hypothetical protein
MVCGVTTSLVGWRVNRCATRSTSHGGSVHRCSPVLRLLPRRCSGGMKLRRGVLAVIAMVVVSACSGPVSTEGDPTTEPAGATTPVTTASALVRPRTQPDLEPTISGLTEAWRSAHPDVLANPPPDGAGFVDDGTTIVVPGTRNLVAFDAVTGAQLWTSPLAISSIVRPVADRVVNGLVLAATEPRLLTALDVRTGRTVWQTSIDATDCSGLGAPRVTDSLVFVTIAEPCRQSIVAARLAAFDVRSGAAVWERTLDGARGNAISAPPLAADDIVVVGAMVGDVEQRAGRTDSYFAFDAATGVSRWKTHFDRHADNGVILLQAPTRHENVVVVHEVSSRGQARPAGVDALTGQVRWQSEIGNAVLVGDVLIGLDLVRADPQQPVVAKALSVRTGQTLWRDDQMRGSPFVDDPRRLAWLWGLQLAAVETRTGSVRWTVPIPPEASIGRAFRQVVSLDDHVLLISTTPPSNVTQPRAVVQLLAIRTGAVVTHAEHDLFITMSRRVGDMIVLIGSKGPTHPSAVIGYRIVG